MVVGGKLTHMTDLISRLLKKDSLVIGFPVREYWIDIGQRTDYEQAKRDTENGQLP